MPRKPKPKNTLSAGERARLYEAERKERQRRMRSSDELVSQNMIPASDTADMSIEKSAKSADEIFQKNEPKAKKVLPKPQKVVLKVDLSIPVGEIKPLHGMCNGPVSYGADITSEFREIGVPYIRFDCTDTAMSAYAVDVSRIFKNLAADPSDEDNYDFSVTDKYVEAALLSGAKVIYRLGESRDLLSKREIGRPEDIDTLARACVNIIRHYNDRWAGGYSYGIEYFEVWNVSCDRTESGDEQDLEIYRRIANAVKLYDESLKVGGLSCRGFDGARELLRYCKRNRTPIDFVTVDVFGGDIDRIADDAEKLTGFIKRSDLGDIDVIIGKWSYFDEEVLSDADLLKVLSGGGDRFVEMRRKLFAEQRSIKGAAFAAALMLRLNSVSGLFAACHFDAQPTVSPFCSIADSSGVPKKPFFAFKAFGELYRAGKATLCEVESAEGFGRTGIYAASALSDSGEGYVMIASFGGCGTVDIRLDGIPDDLYTADIYMLDGVKDMTLGDSLPLSGMKKRLVLNVSEYGAVLIKLY